MRKAIWETIKLGLYLYNDHLPTVCLCSSKYFPFVITLPLILWYGIWSTDSLGWAPRSQNSFSVTLFQGNMKHHTQMRKTGSLSWELGWEWKPDLAFFSGWLDGSHWDKEEGKTNEKDEEMNWEQRQEKKNRDTESPWHAHPGSLSLLEKWWHPEHGKETAYILRAPEFCD